MFRVVVIGLGIFALVGCGRETVSEENSAELSNSREVVPAAATAPAVVNLLAGVVQKAMSSDQDSFPALLLGHAIPAGKQPFELQRGTEYSFTYHKLLESTLGFDLIRLEYKISYEAEMSYKGKGHYISNIRFTPVLVEVEPLYSVTAIAVSDAPVNVGTVKDPAASLRFSISFRAKGIGSQNVTDEFVIDGKTGLLTARIQDWK